MIEVRDLICKFPDGDGRVIRALDVPSFTLEDGGAMALTDYPGMTPDQALVASIKVVQQTFADKPRLSSGLLKRCSAHSESAFQSPPSRTGPR